MKSWRQRAPLTTCGLIPMPSCAACARAAERRSLECLGAWATGRTVLAWMEAPGGTYVAAPWAYVCREGCADPEKRRWLVAESGVGRRAGGVR